MDAVEAIQKLMDDKKMRRKDVFSSKRQASEIMNRKRPLTLKLIRRLHFEFDIPAEVLLTETVEQGENHGSL